MLGFSLLPHSRFSISADRTHFRQPKNKYTFPRFISSQFSAENIPKMFKNASILFALLACCILTANCGRADGEESDGSGVSGWFKKLGYGINAKMEEAREDLAKVKEGVEVGMQRIGNDCSSTEGWMNKIGCGLKTGAEALKDATENEVKKVNNQDDDKFWKFRGLFE